VLIIEIVTVYYDHQLTGAHVMKFEDGIKVIDEAIAEMDDPVVDSKCQVVVARRQELRVLHNKGYTWDQIAAKLTAKGFKITGNTLKVYVNGASLSRAAKTAGEAIKKRQSADKKTRAAQEAPKAGRDRLPLNATEATAKGRPVLARRIR
jgi:hypothetical protein